MRKLTAIILGLCLSGIGFSQSNSALGDPQPVDIRTVWANWSPTGDFLAYSRETESGVALGVYPVGAAQGTTVLQLKRTDSWVIQWFDNQDAAIVFVTSSDTRGKRIAAYLLQAKPASATKLIDEASVDQNLGVDADLSPLLEHGIFTVRKMGATTHYVLPPGGTELVRSTDVDEAEKEGMIGPRWAASGTAFYVQAGDSSQSRTPAGDKATSLAQLLNMYRLETVRSVPASGEIGLELMPDTGILRQVKSPGPWNVPNRAALPIVPDRRPAQVTAGQFSGKSQSLWLSSHDQTWSTLVAPSATASWLSPTGASIAYTVDGALFVRSLKL